MKNEFSLNIFRFKTILQEEQLKLRHGDSLSHWHYNPTYCLFCCFWTLGMGVESIGCCVWLSPGRMLYQHRLPLLGFHYTISLDWVGSIIVSVMLHILFLTNNKCKNNMDAWIEKLSKMLERHYHFWTEMIYNQN